MTATSPALNVPSRSQEQAEAERYMRRLDDLASHFEMTRDRIRNSAGGGGADIERRAGRAGDDAFAIRWAMGQIRGAEYAADVTDSIAGPMQRAAE